MATPTWFKTAYRIFHWGSVALLLLVVVLVLRKSPAPAVANDPNAAARVEQKFAAADQAKANGQPAQVQLDSTELNSYLSQNLQFAGSTQNATPVSALPAGIQSAGASAP